MLVNQLLHSADVVAQAEAVQVRWAGGSRASCAASLTRLPVLVRFPASLDCPTPPISPPSPLPSSITAPGRAAAGGRGRRPGCAAGAGGAAPHAGRPQGLLQARVEGVGGQLRGSSNTCGDNGSCWRRRRNHLQRIAANPTPAAATHLPPAGCAATPRWRWRGCATARARPRACPPCSTFTAPTTFCRRMTAASAPRPPAWPSRTHQSTLWRRRW